MFALTVPFLWATDNVGSEAGVRTDPGLTSTLPMAATHTELLNARLRNQQLIESRRRDPKEVVASLCAMQAQDFPAAKWAIGIRIGGCQDADVEQAFNEGHILRTHVLRPTWHFVAPEDIRWLLSLSAPRIHAANAYYYRQAGLDAKTFAKSCAMIHRTLEGGQALTRSELAVYLKRAKVPADGLKLAYLMMHAELEGVICSGPRKGKQFTYALLDERAPGAKTLDREAALVELARRYFTSHGPATLRDFAWWSGVTIKDAQFAADAATLEQSSIDGVTHFSGAAASAAAARSTGAFLLPNYDEYLIAYKDRAPLIDAGRAANVVARSNGAFANHVVIDGRLAGSWSRTIRTNAVVIEASPYMKWTRAQTSLVAAATDCYGEFLGLPATLSVV